jgi:cell wall-associated NlpC family hydrolase
VRTSRTFVPLPTPSLATRAAVVATGTTAAALLTLLPAAAPAPVPTAVATSLAAPAGPFQAAKHAFNTTQATPGAALRVTSPLVVGAAEPAAGAVQAPVKLVAAAQPAPAKPAVPAASARRGSAMAIAMGKLGSPYRWGAAGPGAFDCSGLVYWSYRQAGLTLPRSSRAQSQVGAAVSKGALQPGDLVFFYRPVSHVAIYIGNGRVVHASTAGKPVKISNLNDMPFTSARRI